MENRNRSLKKSHYHAVYNIQYHLVLVTKYRRPVFTKPLLDYLNTLCHEQCQHWGLVLLEFGGEADHIHLLIDAHPVLDMSKFINSLKTVSSRMLRKHFSKQLNKFYWKPMLWTRAYCLISVGGAPLSILKDYINNQNTPQ